MMKSKKILTIDKNKKICFAPKKSLIMPPAKGVNEGAMPIAIDNKPNIFTVSFSDEISPIIALDKTKPAAEEACKSLKNKNVDRVSEKKHPTEPNMNTKKNASITVRLPYRSDRGPATKFTNATAKRYPDIVNWIVL